MFFRKYLTLCTLVAALAFTTSYAMLPPPMTEDLEWKGRIVITISEELATLSVQQQDGLALTDLSDFDVLAARYNVHRISQLIPGAQKPTDPGIQDISRYYIVEFPYEVDLHEVIEAYQQLSEVEIAEPYYIRKLEYIPNDSYWGNQWAMEKVNAELAFDYARGSSDLILGVVDSGTDTLHEDLKDNLWVNPGEDLNGNGIIETNEWNGIDDDGNSFVDDFWGWNVWQNSNNIQDPTSAGHGSHCAGDANAVTDNATGISSLGWKAKILTALAGDGEYVYAGTNGITYCVQNGADVISLSWGGTSYSSYEQGIVTNAYNNGVLIFGSAGNENSSFPHYPSSYLNVICVAATDQNDIRASFSNYGTDVDICSPGVAIMSTTPGNTYYSWQGTSMSCPIAAGLGLLVWAARPEFTNQEVEFNIYFNCVDIDDLNPSYAGLLGWGRIDAGATIASLFPNLSYTEKEFDDSAGNGDDRPDPGETVDYLVTVQNTSQSQDATGVEVTLSCDDPDITMVQGTSVLGNIDRNNSANNHSDPIQFTVNPEAASHEVTFTLTLHETGFDLTWEEEITQMIGRPDVLIVADDGGSGYSTWYDQDLRELSIQPDIWDVDELGEISDTEMALYPIVFWHTSTTSDPLSTGEQTLIEDFLDSGGKLLLAGQDIDEQLTGTAFYSDVLHTASSAGTGAPQVNGIDGNPLTDGLSLLLLGAGGAGNSTSPSTIEPTNGGSLIFEYATSAAGAGISWEDGSTKLVYLAFNFEAASGNGTSLRIDFLTNMLTWFGANPVLEPHSSGNVPTMYDLGQNYPNPFNPTTTIAFNLPKSSFVRLAVYDLNGRKVADLIEGDLPAGAYTQHFNAAGLASGVYIYRIQAEEYTATRKMILIK